MKTIATTSKGYEIWAKLQDRFRVRSLSHFFEYLITNEDLLFELQMKCDTLQDKKLLRPYRYSYIQKAINETGHCKYLRFNRIDDLNETYLKFTFTLSIHDVENKHYIILTKNSDITTFKSEINDYINFLHTI